MVLFPLATIAAHQQIFILRTELFPLLFPYKSEVKPEVHMVFSKSSGSNVRRTVGMFVVRQRKM